MTADAPIDFSALAEIVEIMNLIENGWWVILVLAVLAGVGIGSALTTILRKGE